MSRRHDHIPGPWNRWRHRLVLHPLRPQATRQREDMLFVWLDAPDSAPPAGEVGRFAAETQTLLTSNVASLGEARKDEMWKEIMMQTALVESAATSIVERAVKLPTSERRAGPIQRFRPHSAGKWASAMNAAAMLVLVVAILAGFMSLRGRGPAPATPLHMAIGLGTPTGPAQTPLNLTGLASPAASASKCTVKPLTVDEVMAKLTGRDPIVPLAPKSFYNKALTPETESPLSGTLDTTTMNELIHDQEVWLSCIEEGKWFQAWAFESPDYLHQEFTRIYFPVLSLDQVRTDLEALKNGSTNTPFHQPVFENGWVPVIVPNALHMSVDWNNPESARVTVAVQWMTPDGKNVGPNNDGLWPFWYTPTLFTYVRIKDGPWLLYGTAVSQG